jgi:hypothetical protein
MPWYVAWAPTPWDGRLGCIYSPQHKTSRWRKVVLSAAHRTVWWCTRQCTVQCLVRLSVDLTVQTTVGAQAFYTGHSRRHMDSSVVFPPKCHLKLAVGLLFPGAPVSPACGTGHSACNTFFVFGLHLIFIMSSFEVLLSSMSWSK